MSSQSKSSNGEPMRIFVTGATGYIGQVVTELALAEGHTVRGLSRNEEGDAKLRALGATPVRGDLSTLDVLRRESAEADAVLHLAYIHDFTMDYEEVLRIDGAAVDAMGEPLRGTGKALVTSSGTLLVQPDPSGAETPEDAPDLISDTPLKNRIRSERHGLSLSKEGVRVSSIRLPPYVYGRGGSYFLPLLMQMAVKDGESAYLDDGSVSTCGVHVDDAAALYLLAMKLAKPGEVFNGNGDIVTYRELAEAIGVVLELPVRSISVEEAGARWGPFLTTIVQMSNRPSNRKAIQQLGWQLRGLDMLTDIKSGSYRAVAEKLRQGSLKLRPGRSLS